MSAINNGYPGTRLQQQLRATQRKNDRGAMLGAGLWSVVNAIGNITGLTPKIAVAAEQTKIVAQQIVSIAPSVASAISEVAAETFGEIASRTANVNYRNIDADVESLKQYLKTSCGLSDQEIAILIAEIDEKSAEVLDNIPIQTQAYLNSPEKLLQYYSLAMMKNIVVSYKQTDAYKKSTDSEKNQDVMGKSIAHAVNALVGKLPQAEMASERSAAQSIGYGGPNKQAIVDEMVKIFMPADGARLLMRGEAFLTKKLTNFFVPAIIDKYVKGYLMVSNDVSEVLPANLQIADELIEHFATNTLPGMKQPIPDSPDIEDQAVPSTPVDPKRVLFDKLLNQTLGSIDPVKTPELYHYARSKIHPIIALAFQQLHNEGQRIKEGTEEGSMDHLDDHALILLGGFSISKFLAQELLKSDSTTESLLNALKIRFPGFAEIQLPPELQKVFLNALQEQGAINVIPAGRNLENLIAKDGENSQALIEMYGQKPVAPDADPNEPVVSTIDAPIQAIKNLIFRVVKELVAEEGDDSLSQDLALGMQKSGFKLSEGQSQNFMHLIAHSENPEIVDAWDLMEAPVDSLLKELFVRFGRVSVQNPNLLIDLIEKIAVKLGTDRAAGDTGVRVPNYQKFTLELLAMLGFNGPEDLDFIHPAELRQKVWELFGNKIIGEMLKIVMTRIFNPDALRDIFISIIKTINEAPDGPPSRVVRPHVMLNASTYEAFGKIGARLADKLKIPHVRGKMNDARFLNRMGRTLADTTFDTLQNMYGDPTTGKPSILKLIAHSLEALTPVLESTELPPELETEQAEKFREKLTAKRIAAENSVRGARAQLDAALVEHADALDSPEVESARTAFERTEVIRDRLIAEERSAIQNAARLKACLGEIHAARREEFIALAKKLPRTQTKMFIKGLWGGFKKIFKDRAVIIFGARAVRQNKTFFKQVRKYLFLNLLGRLFKLAAVLPKEVFWKPIESIAEIYARRSDRLLDEYAQLIADMPFDILGGVSEAIERQQD